MLRIVVILAASMAVSPADQNKPSSHANGPRRHKSTNQNSAPVAVQGKPPDNTTNYYTYQAPEKQRDWLESAYFYSGPLACILSFVTALAIYGQIRNHARAERPWILLSMADQFSEFTGEDSFIIAHWKVKNFGKTPALIDSITGAVTVVGDLTNIPTLTFTEPFSVAFEPVIAPQNESSSVSFKGERISKEVANDLLQQHAKYFVVIAGCVEYRDSFNNRHTSKFCYSYIYWPPEAMGFNQMCGPESYNKYT